MWIGATANVTTYVFAALVIFLFNPMEGPTFQNNFPTRGQLFVSFRPP